jgi:hypothetical protein
MISPQTTPSFTRTSYTSKEELEKYRSVAAPHVESFNYFLEYGFQQGVSDLDPEEFDLINPNEEEDAAAKALIKTQEEDAESKDSDGSDSEDSKKKTSEPAAQPDGVDSVRFWVENFRISPPCKEVPGKGMKKMYPRECRELGIVYSGKCNKCSISATCSNMRCRTEQRIIYDHT